MLEVTSPNDGESCEYAGRILENVPISDDTVDRMSLKVGMEVSAPFESNGFSRAKIREINPCFHSEIAKRIEDRRGREMPGFMPFPVFCETMIEFIER